MLFFKKGGIVMNNEIRTKAALRNDRLYRAIFESWPNLSAFCREKGYSVSMVSPLINLKKSPVTKKGRYRKICRDLAKEFGIPAECLFPLEIYGIEKSNAAAAGSASQMSEVQTPLDSIPAKNNSFLEELEKSQDIEMLSTVLNRLKPREAEIIKMRFGLDCPEHTYAEIAQKLGLSNARARQLTLRAISSARRKYRQLTGWYSKQLLSEKT